MTVWVIPTAAGAVPLPCPACSRVVAPDMLIDVRLIPLPSPWRPRNVEALCDACRERVVRSGAATAADLYRALGAPEATAALVDARAE
jgi:hypothetical protein